MTARDQLPDYPHPMYAAPGSRPPASWSLEGLIFIPNDGTAWSICLSAAWRTMPTGGGGGGFTIMDQEIDVNSETVIADASPHNLSWVFSAGTAVLDVSSPSAPTVLVNGWYGFNLQLALDAGDAPGQFGAFILTILDGSIPQYVLIAEENEDLTFGPGSLFGMTIQTPLLYLLTTYSITAQFAINVAPNLLVDTQFRTYYYH